MIDKIVAGKVVAGVAISVFTLALALRTSRRIRDRRSSKIDIASILKRNMKVHRLNLLRLDDISNWLTANASETSMRCWAIYLTPKNAAGLKESGGKLDVLGKNGEGLILVVTNKKNRVQNGKEIALFVFDEVDDSAKTLLDAFAAKGGISELVA